MQNNTLKTAILAALIGMNIPAALHAELNTALPGEQEESFALPLNIDLPAQPLAAALRQFAIQSNLSLTVDSALIVDKKAPAVKGRMTRKEAIKRLLDGSGLQGKVEGEKILIQRAVKAEAKDIQLDKVEVRAKRFYEVGPLPGLGLTKEEIPGNVQSISAKEIKEAHSLSLTDLMNRKLQSVTVNDYQGNPFQMDVQYRGFTAGPQIGTPQGLSVFFDGIRVNEPFGDVVNWDMIPMNALAGVDVFPGSNPIFGLNTLGGAFSMKTKDGFNNSGVDAEVLTGSFGRKQLQAEAGWNNGTVGLFAAGNFFLEDGWRQNSPSKVNQLFTKASYRGDKLDLNLSTLLVQTDLVGNGLIPSEEYGRDRNAVFSSPDTTVNKLQQFQLSGSYFVNDNFTITGQVYRRNSDRRQKGSDVMNDYPDTLTAKRRLDPGEQYSCLFRSSGENAYGAGSRANAYGLPDYIVIPIVGYDPTPATGTYLENSNFYDEIINQGTFDLANYTSNINTELPEEFLAAYRYKFILNRNFGESEVFNRNLTPVAENGAVSSDFFNENQYNAAFVEAFNNFPSGINGVVFGSDYYFKKDPVSQVITKYYVMVLSPLNEGDCAISQSTEQSIMDDTGFTPIMVDGIGGNQPGYVEGTPTAIITDNQINQVTDGLSMQFNWNLDKHKFMVGASIDSAGAEYINEQRLGFFDASRNAYLDPAQAHPQFAAAFVPLKNNDFEGTNITKSLYFSETWSPIDSVHFSFSGRYNQTRAKNKIAARSGVASYSIGELIATPDKFNVCTDQNGNGEVTSDDCAGVPTGYRPLRLNDTLQPAETEKFTYHSFNPSVGISWQAKESLNVYANWAKGARTPSVIELGCALDHRPTGIFYSDGQGGTYEVPKSIVENRQCTLPTTLSGDPYLPQIKATTYDVGLRGTWGENLRWNLGAFQTDLKDDIYFIAVGNGQGFFDTIGKTRRRGIEAGLSGRHEKWGFSVNYSLIDATFQDSFLMISNDNSSAFYTPALGSGIIKVNPGNRIPGTALHNLNATVSYDVTDKWNVGLTAIAHSDSFVRGNENNEHRQGVQRQRVFGSNTVLLPPTRNPGTVSGYATFNFQTSYKLSKEWTATMLVNNIFDQEYFTAGRLGRNPFSPSIYGAIGPAGYNHNSGDWLSTNFIAPGAPRGIWFSLNWHFVPD